MEVTLNKANKLRTNVENSGFDVSTLAASISTDSEDPLSVFNIQSAKYKSSLENFKRALEVEFQLRSLIAQENFKNDITDLIGEIAFTEKQIKSLTRVVATMKQMVRPGMMALTYNEFQATVAHIGRVEAADPTQVVRPERKQVVIVDDMQISELEEEIKSLKLHVAKLQEQRNAKNHATLVTLPDDVVKFLKENALI